MSVPAPDLVPESGTVPGGPGGQLPRFGEGPADTAVPAHERGFVGHREHGGEPDPEPADGTLRDLGVPLGGGPQRGQRLDTGRVQRGTGVGGDEDAVAEREPQPAGGPGTGGGIGGVLRELDHEPVPVAAQDQVLLGVGVLAEPGGAGGPGVENTTAQPGRPERIGPFDRRPHVLAAHVPHSPRRREDEGTARGAVPVPGRRGGAEGGSVPRPPSGTGARAVAGAREARGGRSGRPWREVVERIGPSLLPVERIRPSLLPGRDGRAGA